MIREAGDCTNNFGRIEPGTRVVVDGPHGSFILPTGNAPVIMIAGGVGIAPLLGMLEEAAANEDTRSFHLLYAARKPYALAGVARLRELQLRLDLSLQCVVDKSTAEPGYRIGPLRGEHITEMLKGARPEGLVALVCGPAGMMALATDALLAAGVPPGSIRYEHFDYAAGKGRLDRKRRREALAIFLVLLAAIAAFSLRQFFAGFNEIVDDGCAHPWILGVMRFEKSVQFTCALVGLSTPATHARRRALVALCAMFFENRFTRDRERWTWPQQKGALTSPSNRSVELAPTSICTLSKVTDQP